MKINITLLRLMEDNQRNISWSWSKTHNNNVFLIFSLRFIVMVLNSEEKVFSLNYIFFGRNDQ